MDAKEIADWSEPRWGGLEGTERGHRTYTYNERLSLAQMAIDHVPDGGTMVEIGTYGGLSTSVLLQVCRMKKARLIAVDNFAYCGSYSESHLRETLCEFPDVWWRFYATSSEAAALAIKDVATGPIEAVHLLHIDGDHSVGKAAQDFELWSPKLVSGAVVAFHDCIDPDGPVNACTNVWVDAEKFTHGWPELRFRAENWLTFRIKP